MKVEPRPEPQGNAGCGPSAVVFMLTCKEKATGHVGRNSPGMRPVPREVAEAPEPPRGTDRARS